VSLESLDGLVAGQSYVERIEWKFFFFLMSKFSRIAKCNTLFFLTFLSFHFTGYIPFFFSQRVIMTSKSNE
jgi:hypothetical protein